MSPVNRLAWIASLALGMSISITFFGFFGGGTFNILFGLFAGFLIKKIVLPAEFFDTLVSKKKQHIPEEVFPDEVEIQEQEPAEILSNFTEGNEKAKKVQEPVVYEKPTPSKPNPVIAWFAENTLAKVGGILIFLAILAFLSIIYAEIGAVGRLVVSTLVSLGIYISGLYLFKKDTFKHEAQIILGVGIVAIYLSILYMFRVPQLEAAFGPSLSIIVLILLTLAVAWGSITGILFGAPVLFGFSLVIAYLNPFFINTDLTTIQMLVYVILISGGAFATGYMLIRRNKDEKLGTIVLEIGFIGGVFLALFVDKTSSFELNSTFIVLLMLTAGSVWVANGLKNTTILSAFLVGGGLSFFLALLGAGEFSHISTTLIMSIGILGLSGLTYRLAQKIPTNALVILLTIPLILWIVGYVTGFWLYPVVAFGGLMILYAFLLLGISMIPTWCSSLLFVFLGLAGYLFAPEILGGNLPLSSRYFLMGIGVFLFGFGHYYSLKKNISVIPIIHTLISFGLLAINRPGADPFWAILAVFCLAGATIVISSYSHQNKLQSPIDHIGITLIGAASLVSTLVYFGAMQQHWGILLGGILMVVALFYLGAFMLFFRPLQEKISESIIVTFLGVVGSIITLAIAYLFTGNETARTLAWLIEAGLLWGIFSRYQNGWIQFAAIIAQTIGIVQFMLVSPNIDTAPILYGVVQILFFWNLWCLKNMTTEDTVGSELILLGSASIWYGYFFFDNSWSDTQVIFFTQALLMLHMYWQSITFKKIFFSGLVGCLVLFWVTYALPDFYSKSDTFSTNWLYFFAPFAFIPLQYWIARKCSHILTKISWFVVGVGIFFVTSAWISAHFDNPYALTFWWSLWILVLLTLGIQKNIAIVRSMGLMVFLLSLLRVVFVDLGRVFMSNEETGVLLGIGMIMLLGIISIGLSMLYKKIMGEGTLKQDFLFQKSVGEVIEKK